MTWAAGQALVSNFGAGWSQPFTLSTVAERTGNTTNFNTVIAGGGHAAQMGFGGGANLAGMYAGAGNVTLSGVNDNALHAIQGLFNGASSSLSVDGSAAMLSPGTNALDFSLCMGACNNDFVGFSVEGIFFSTDKSASFSALNSNQHTYWGF